MSAACDNGYKGVDGQNDCAEACMRTHSPEDLTRSQQVLPTSTSTKAAAPTQPTWISMSTRLAPEATTPASTPATSVVRQHDVLCWGQGAGAYPRDHHDGEVGVNYIH